MEKSLKEMEIGETAVITGYKKSHQNYRQRLLSMGLTKGKEIKLTKYAPLGDPVEISIMGYSLSLRKDEAECLILKGENNG